MLGGVLYSESNETLALLPRAMGSAQGHRWALDSPKKVPMAGVETECARRSLPAQTALIFLKHAHTGGVEQCFAHICITLTLNF